jgi:DNA-binding beta-propeller fold protein YncE
MKYRRTHSAIASILVSALFGGSLALMPVTPAIAAPFAYIANFCAFLGCPDPSTVSVVDVATGNVVATVPVGSPNTPSGNIYPFLVAVAPDGKHVYVSCDCGSAPPNVAPPSGFNAPIVSVIDTTTNSATAIFASTQFADQGARGLAITPDGSRVYVLGFTGTFFSASPTIFVVDTATNTVVTNIVDARLSNPSQVAITPDGSRAYVVDNTVHIIDTNPASPTYNTIIAEVSTTLSPSTVFGPSSIAITPDGSRAYLPGSTGFNPASVLVIDTNPSSPTYNKILALVGAPGGDSDALQLVAITPDGSRAYITQTANGAGPVHVIDTNPASATYNTQLTTINIAPPNGPQASYGVAITSDGTRAYVTSNEPFAGCCGVVPVSVVDTNPTSPTYNTVIALVTAGVGPIGVAITPTPVVQPQPAPPSGTACNGTYNGTFTGNITVSAGQSCMFISGGKITGNVSVVAGSFGLNGATVGSNLTINGGSFALAGATIDGNFAVVGILPNTASNSICGTTVQGNLKFDNNGTSVQIGSATPSNCAGNTIDGTFEALSNTNSTLIFDNSVAGNMSVNTNTGTTDVVGNKVGRNLQCLGNTMLIMGSGNTASKKSGQCS